MDIPNLSTNPTVAPSPKNVKDFKLLIFFAILFLSIGSGYLLSRFIPISGTSSSLVTKSNQSMISTDVVKDKQDIEVGKVYGDPKTNFKDSATGTVEKGSINGEGTHILNRQGGLTQRASLTSSVVDLDLFVGRTVEVKGETNSSNKTGWLLDVGSVKVLQ